MLSFTLFSCSDDDDDDAPFLGAQVTVNVENVLGGDKAGKTVYMFKNREVTGTTTPESASKMVVTNSEGKAVFDLNFTELSILESQTTLYFAVFYTTGDESKIAGSTGVTVKRGDVKEVHLEVLF